jgi:hypothetical protein
VVYDSLFLGNNICGVDLKGKYTGMIGEIHKVNHWKTLELIFSIALIHNFFFEQRE